MTRAPLPHGTDRLPVDAGLPAQAGIGFKPVHFDALMGDPQPPGFIEVHAENYLGAGGTPHAHLSALCERLPLSVHGVGLSLGGETPPDAVHLARVQALLARCRPAVFSEHLAWSTHDGRFFNDLLPLRYDAACLARVCRHIEQVQEQLGLQLLLENPSTYFPIAGSTYSEPDLLSAIVQRTGCALLLDVNNVHVSCHNQGHDPLAYLAALPLHAVRQIHLAGHARDVDAAGETVLIDDHGAPVDDEVWALYRHVLDRTGPLPTLIEWDTHVPDYATLRAQARQAQAWLDDATMRCAAA